MSREVSDLSVLSRRVLTDAVPSSSRPVGPPASVPPPPPRWKTRVLLPAAMLLALAGLLAYSARDALWPATPVRVVPVVVRTVQQSGGGFSVQAPGWVEADPYATSVSALAEGVVKEVLVLEGEQVKAGQVVARMIDDDARLAVARAGAEAAEREGALDAARAALAAARRDWENPVERARAVETWRAMRDEAKAELDRLPVQVAGEAARVDELRDAADRNARAAGNNAIAQSELIQTRLRLRAQEALLAATQANEPVLEAKLRQTDAELAAARRNAELRIPERKALDEAKANLRAGEAALARAKVGAEEAKLRLARMEVRSPSDGVVMVRHAEPGAKLMLSSDDPRSAHAVRLYDPAKLQVRVDVPLADAAQVSVGQAAKVVVGVLPDESFDGVVTRVVHEADIQRNTLQVKVAIKSPGPELKPEMLARVRFIAPMRQLEAANSQQVFAPEALLRGNGAAASQAKVWVVDKGQGVATSRPVTLGDARVEGWVAVTSGLQPGDVLISGDTSHLHEGHRVRIVEETEGGGAPSNETTNNTAARTAPGGNRGAH